MVGNQLLWEQTFFFLGFVHSHQCDIILPYPFILTILILGVLSCSSWRCGIEEYVSWHSRLSYITTAKTMRRRFGSLFSVGYGSSLMLGAPVGGCPIGRLPQPELPPWTTRRSVLITRAVPRGAAWMVVGWSPMDWWQNKLISSNGQFRVFLDVDLTRWHRYGRPWSFLWRRGSRWDLPGTPCSSSCWFAISGLMVLEASPFYPLIKTVLLLNRVSSILYFNPLAMGQYPSAS